MPCEVHVVNRAGAGVARVPAGFLTKRQVYFGGCWSDEYG